MSISVIRMHMLSRLDILEPARTWCDLGLAPLMSAGVFGIASNPDACNCVGCLGEAALGIDPVLAAQAAQRLHELAAHANAAKVETDGVVAFETDGPHGLLNMKECPQCKSPDVLVSYGLAGGGIGVYVACDGCKYFAKRQDIN